MSAFDHVGSIEPLRIWDGVTAWPVHGDEVTMTVIELAPDAVVPEHSHVNEQIGVLLRGSMRFRIGDEEREVTRGATWCIRAHVPHQVHTGPDGATIAEVFAPPRGDWAGLERLDAGAPPGF
jgi:quercetin dioxygenase-like cupin family protein